MKKILTLTFVTAFMVAAFPVEQHASASGDFLSSTSWANGSIPAASDSIMIGSGFTITMSQSGPSVYGNLTILPTGSLNIGTATIIVDAVAVTGILQIGASTTSGLNCTGLTAASTSLNLQTNSAITNKGNLSLSASAHTSFLGTYTQNGNATWSNPNPWYSCTISSGTVTLLSDGYFTGLGSANTSLLTTINLNGFNAYIGGTGTLTLGTASDFVGTASVITSFPAVTLSNSRVTAWSFTGNLSPLGELATTTMIPAINVSNANVATLCNGVGTNAFFQFTAGTLKCKDFTFNSFTGASNVVIDASGYNPSLNVSGSFIATTSGVVTTWTRGTGTITLSGSAGTQLINFGTLNPLTEAIVIAAAGTEKQIVANFRPLSLNVTGGWLFSNSAGSRRTIAGTNTGTATNSKFRDISMGSANKLNAKSATCTNLGNNLGIVFKDTVR